MGNFYFNYTLKGPRTAEVVRALKGNRTLVTPEQNGCVVVFPDSGCPQDLDPKMAADLTADLNCSLLRITVHDDNILMSDLFVSGDQIDAYDSNPDYFQGGSKRGPLGGDAAVLCKAFGSTEVQEVERILRTRSEIYRFEHKRHEELVQFLGLSTFAVAMGYEYAARGDISDFYGLKISDMTQTE